MLFKPSLNFVTSLIYSSQVAKMLNNLTFLYNPSWVHGQGNEPNMPIAFFFVKDCKEVGETQVSTKTLMFYNSQNNSDSKTRQGALLDVVADNALNLPKEYQLDVLVPFEASAYFKQFQMNANSQESVSMFMANEDARMQGLSTALTATEQLLKILFSALSIDLSNIADYANFVLQQNDINKVSLEFMRDSRRILKMKWWNGWKFKYVMIKSLDIEKKGTDEAFYEGRITLTEVPVMTVMNEDQLQVGSNYKSIGVDLCGFLDKWFNTREQKLQGEVL